MIGAAGGGVDVSEVVTKQDKVRESKKEELLALSELESQITPRRLREAVLGDVGSLSFVRDLDKKIRKARKDLGMDEGKIRNGIVDKIIG